MLIAHAIFRETFSFRQGLWTEDLRTPPEQECSNGSLILFAVVLWRTFFWLNVMARFADETPEGQERRAFARSSRNAASPRFTHSGKNRKRTGISNRS